MRRALVTGVTGQTGSYLAEQLLQRGWEVTGIASSSGQSVDGVDLIPLDVTDPDRLAGVIAEVRPHAVVNLAALSSVWGSWQDPIRTATTNALAPAAVLAATMALHDSGHDCSVVQASSAEIFGTPDRSPQDEWTRIAPTNPYGATKAYAHHLVGVYRSLGLRASSAILFNHESPRRPERFVTRTISSGVARIVRGETDTLTLAAPSIRRDWGWAPDYADAIRRIVEHDTGRDFVVATGTTRSVADFAVAALRSAGIDQPASRIRTGTAGARPADTAEMRGDATRIRSELGWRPTVAFDEIARRMVEADVARGAVGADLAA